MKNLIKLSLSVVLILFVSLQLTASGKHEKEVLQIIDKVNAKWQETHTDPGNSFWDNSAYQTGNMAAYEVTGNPDYLAYATLWANQNNWMGATGTDQTKWKFKYGETQDHVLFGDWQICFQTYIDLFNITPDSNRVKRAMEVMNYEISSQEDKYLWWVDGLYMVMPVMSKMYKLTGNEKYLEKLIQYYKYAESIMLDKESGLFYRDTKYIFPEHKSLNGKKDFWSRGDGWLFAGLARIIPDLPLYWKYRPVFVDQYLKMAATLQDHQQKDGYWTRSILDPAHAPGPETSGTAFYTYGYLWGINYGLLTDKKYEETAMKGWKYLSKTALQKDGTIGYVQPIGERAIPGQVVNKNSSSNFGTGAFLLAATELYRYFQQKEEKDPFKAYLFAYFTGNRMEEEQIRFAISYDGLNYLSLNNDRPIVKSTDISLSGGVRDPHLLRGDDGNFYMVVTDMVSDKGWNSNRGMVLLKSKDMVNWTSSAIHIPAAFKEFSDVLRVWAPQTIWDAKAKKYMVYFSMIQDKPGEYDKIYYAYVNKDFTALETIPKQLYFPEDHKACIDADIIYEGGKYHMFYKTEGGGKGIFKAESKELTGPYNLVKPNLQQTTRPVEGAGVFQMIGKKEWILMYDMYTSGRYQFTRSSDLLNFKEIKEPMSMDFHPRHGTVIQIRQSELDRLLNKWPINNAALKGYFADPDIIYSNQTGKYYIYPTSDGFDGWSGNYFEVFSSDNLMTWKKERKIIQLGEDVKWANRNAWAPCIIEKKVNDKYKYYYYFTAAQKVGVAVADTPTGPFMDSGKPLISSKPEGVRGGQVIDPDVFQDPETGKFYLYWGNGFLAGAELNDDMISIKEETLHVFKTPKGFREGTHVFYRNGKYYFSWSIDDTRSPNYSVGYGISNGPLGEIEIPENYVILQKDPSKGIFGTGHHSTIQIPGKDEWYMIYHRFNYPAGIRMGDPAGFNREVCLDKMEFNEDGSIQKVHPTHQGVIR